MLLMKGLFVAALWLAPPLSPLSLSPFSLSEKELSSEPFCLNWLLRVEEVKCSFESWCSFLNSTHYYLVKLRFAADLTTLKVRNISCTWISFFNLIRPRWKSLSLVVSAQHPVLHFFGNAYLILSLRELKKSTLTCLNSLIFASLSACYSI